MDSKSIMFVGILALISVHSIAQQQQTVQDIQATGMDLREMAEQLNLDRYGNQGISSFNNPLDLRNYQIPFKYVKPEQFIPKKYWVISVMKYLSYSNNYKGYVQTVKIYTNYPRTTIDSLGLQYHSE